MESLNNNPFTISHNASPQNPSEETHQALGIKIVGGASTSDAIDDFGSLHDRQVESLPPVHEVQAVNTPFFKKEDFGNDFKWGVATAAYQIEGAWNVVLNFSPIDMSYSDYPDTSRYIKLGRHRGNKIPRPS